MSKPESTDEPRTLYPRLHHVLTTYFPSHSLGRDDREGEFMAAYADRGEEDPEFAGLANELRTAIRSPEQATPMVNEDLGITFSPRQAHASLKDLLNRLATEEAEQDYHESENFPQLQQVLLTYFPSAATRRRNRTTAFLEAYETYGENKAEFAGLADELREAVKYPKRAAPMVNEALGTDLQTTQVRTELSDLLDQITKQGSHDPDNAEQPDAEKTTPREDLDHWFFRKVNPFPGRFQRYHFPLWQGLLGGGVSTGIGLAILSYLPVPDWLTWIPFTLIIVGLVAVAMFSITMTTLRNQAKTPERHKESEEVRVRLEANKLEKQERRRRILRIFSSS